MRRGLLRIAFFTGRKEKRLPDARDEGCTCIDMQVVHNVPEYAAKFLRPHNLKTGFRSTWSAKCGMPCRLS